MRFVITIVVVICFCFFLWYRKKAKKEKCLDGMKEVSIIVPGEKYHVVECLYEEDKPAIIVLNSNLRDFKEKDVFGWTCSLTIYYKDLKENGMPTHEESDIVLDYVEKLDSAIKGDPDHPNALFVARETCDGQINVFWQLNEPEPVHQYLQSIIEENSYPREMEYRIEYDAEWKSVEWFLKDFSKTKVERDEKKD